MSKARKSSLPTLCSGIDPVIGVLGASSMDVRDGGDRRRTLMP